MSSRNKNILIGSLLAIVLIMAVGYAAFSQALNITGSATVSSTWDVHLKNDKTAVSVTKGVATGTNPTGTISSISATSASISASLQQPGDSVVFTFHILNTGSIAARVTQPVISGTASNDWIQWTVGTISNTSLPATSGDVTFTVTATFKSSATNTPTQAAQKTQAVTVNFTASQA